MDATTFFSFRCPACNGRSRVASRHAGQVIVCPYCQAHGTAQPDVRPNVVPTTSQIRRPDGASPATTTRVARPLEPVTTSTVRRERVEASDLVISQQQQQPRATAPGMDGFAENRPGTATIQRRMAAQQPAAAAPQPQAAQQPQPATQSIQRTIHVAPPPPKQGSLFAALAAAALAAGIAVWAFSEANAVNRALRESRDRLEHANGELTALKSEAESQERRLAQSQIELAAERAATTRERQVVSDLQRTVDKMGAELARIARTGGEPELSMVPTASAVNAVTAPGAFPLPTIPSAGVPNTRRDSARP
jgi:hypothetical protein